MTLDNVGVLADYVEMLAGQAGVNRDDISRELIWTIINEKAIEFCSRTNIRGTDATKSSVANQQEYQLPPDKISITKIMLDGSRIKNRMNFNELENLKTS